jgi:hypothetical protein
MSRAQHALIAFTLFASLHSLIASAQPSDDQLQVRYRLCMDKTDTDFLEEFRDNCDDIFIRQHRNKNNINIMPRHSTWNTANCRLSIAEENRMDLHLERAKDRCLNEFKAGITAPP